MKYASVIARLLLGLMFTVFGLNGFFHFISMPPMPDGPAKDFTGAMAATHYMVPVFLLQVISGLLFLVGRFVPLALTLIGPVLVNILLFHLLMAPSGIGPGAVATILWFIVFAHHRAAFTGIFQAKSAD
jgi:putative oxidoreductase